MAYQESGTLSKVYIFTCFTASVTIMRRAHNIVITSLSLHRAFSSFLNPLTPNDHYSRRAPLTSTRCILYIYSTSIGTEHFKHGIYSPFFPLQNAVCFIILTSLVPVVFIFYIRCVKIKKDNSGAKRLRMLCPHIFRFHRVALQ